MKSIKRVVSLLLATAMTVSLAACGGSSASSSAPASSAAGGSSAVASGTAKDAATSTEPVTIRFSWWGGDSRHVATQAAVEAFMKKYPHITVECEYGAWDGWPEKCATQLNAGTAPDLMQVNWNWLYQFSSDGSKFADLKTLGVNLGNYPDKILEQCVVAGKQQGLPIGTTGKCFFWNKTTFDKAGIAIPKTIDELMAAGTTFKEKLGDQYYPLAMYQYERVIFMLYYLEAKYGKNWVEDGKVQYSVEEVKEGLDWLCSLEDAHVLPLIATLQGDGATILEKNTKWSNGTYAGFYEWDSANKKLMEALEPGQEFVLGDFITGIGSNEAGLTKISQCFAVTEASPNKEAAALLMDYLVNDPEGIEILSTERGMLANSYANEVLQKLGKFDGNLTYDANQAVLKIANYSFDPNFENSELKDPTGVYYEVMENISADHSTTGEMAQYLLDEIERIQNENKY